MVLDQLAARFKRLIRGDRYGRAMMTHLARKRTDCVLDVGANTGQFARDLRNRGYRHRIESFEPVRSSFEELSRRCSGDPGWTAHHLALGAADTATTINVFARDDFSSTLALNERGRDYIGGPEIVASEQVSMQRLDSFLSGRPAASRSRSIFLKSDTQGLDLDVVRGAGEYLKWINGIQVELSVHPLYDGIPPLAEALGSIDDLGFSLIGIRPLSWSEGILIEMDGLFRNRGWLDRTEGSNPIDE